MSVRGRSGLLAVFALALAACVPRAMSGQGELVELERGLTGSEVIARMGRPPDEVKRLGPHVEDWVYIELELERTFMLRMHDGRLRWTKMIEQAGRPY